MEPILPSVLLRLTSTYLPPVEADLLKLVFPALGLTAFRDCAVTYWLMEHLMDGNVVYLDFLLKFLPTLKFQNIPVRGHGHKTHWAIITDDAPFYDYIGQDWSVVAAIRSEGTLSDLIQASHCCSSDRSLDWLRMHYHTFFAMEEESVFIDSPRRRSDPWLQLPLKVLCAIKGESFVAQHLFAEAVWNREARQVLGHGFFFAQMFDHCRESLQHMLTADVFFYCFCCDDEDCAIRNSEILRQKMYVRITDLRQKISEDTNLRNRVTDAICGHAHIRLFDQLGLGTCLTVERASALLVYTETRNKRDARCQLFLRLASIIGPCDKVDLTWRWSFCSDEAVPWSVRQEVVTQLHRPGISLLPPEPETLYDSIRRGIWSPHMSLGDAPQDGQVISELINVVMRQNSPVLLRLIFGWFQRQRVWVTWDPRYVLCLLQHKRHPGLLALVRWVINETDVGSRLMASPLESRLKAVLLETESTLNVAVK